MLTVKLCVMRRSPKGLDLVVLRIMQQLDGSPLSPGRQLPAALNAPEGAQRHTLAALPLGDATKLTPGEQLVVLGLGQPNKQSGSIVRPLFPTFRALKETGSGRWIETPAMTHSGHSGGPVLSARGEVVGWVSRSQAERQVGGHVYVIDEHRPIDSPSNYTEPLQCIWGAVAAALGCPDKWQQPDVLREMLRGDGTIAAGKHVYDPNGTLKPDGLAALRREHDARTPPGSRIVAKPTVAPPNSDVSSLSDAFDAASLGGASFDLPTIEEAEAPVAPAHKGWFDPLPLETRQRIRSGDIPVVVVIGETGAGKSTAINRMTSPMSQERSSVMKESATAAAGTAVTDAKLLSWLGEENHPVVFVDMPGLSDPEGKDGTIIRDACTFLRSAPFPGLHQIVLVINGQSQRLSKPLKEVIRVLREVFDPAGKQGFVEHLSVMFTKIPFEAWSFKTKKDFEANVLATEGALADSWASLDEGLGQKGVLDLSHAEAVALKKRFLFVNNGLETEMLAHLKESST